jgi:hypothetical protein
VHQALDQMAAAVRPGISTGNWTRSAAAYGISTEANARLRRYMAFSECLDIRLQTMNSAHSDMHQDGGPFYAALIERQIFLFAHSTHCGRLQHVGIRIHRGAAHAYFVMQVR